MAPAMALGFLAITSRVTCILPMALGVIWRWPMPTMLLRTEASKLVTGLFFFMRIFSFDFIGPVGPSIV